LPASTPAAIVQKGTTPEQRIVIGTLASLPTLAAAERLAAPTLIIIGEVVSLHERLAWFDPASERTSADEPVASAASG